MPTHTGTLTVRSQARPDSSSVRHIRCGECSDDRRALIHFLGRISPHWMRTRVGCWKWRRSTDFWRSSMRGHLLKKRWQTLWRRQTQIATVSSASSSMWPQCSRIEPSLSRCLAVHSLKMHCQLNVLVHAGRPHCDDYREVSRLGARAGRLPYQRHSESCDHNRATATSGPAFEGASRQRRGVCTVAVVHFTTHCLLAGTVVYHIQR